jgi:hypothetical protein
VRIPQRWPDSSACRRRLPSCPQSRDRRGRSLELPTTGNLKSRFWDANGCRIRLAGRTNRYFRGKSHIGEWPILPAAVAASGYGRKPAAQGYGRRVYCCPSPDILSSAFPAV